MTEQYQSLSDVIAFCPTSNCTWDLYNSLAVCYSTQELRNAATNNNTSFASDQVDSETFWGRSTLGHSFTDNHDAVLPVKTLEDTFQTVPDIARIYLYFYDPCIGGLNMSCSSPGSSNDSQSMISNPRNWRALKGTLSICIQTLDTSYYERTFTRVHAIPDTTWKYHTVVGSGWTSEGAYRSTGPEKMCVGSEVFNAAANTLQKTFKISANLAPCKASAFFTEWAPQLVVDTLGHHPSVCTTNPGDSSALTGFAGRLQNISISMTNT